MPREEAVGLMLAVPFLNGAEEIELVIELVEVLFSLAAGSSSMLTMTGNLT